MYILLNRFKFVIDIKIMSIFDILVIYIFKNISEYSFIYNYFKLIMMILLYKSI